MLLFEVSTVFEPKDAFTHRKFVFSVPQNIKKLVLDYKYSPKRLEDEALSVDLIKACYKRYGLTASDSDIKAELPLNNLLTVSLDSPMGIVGNAHRHLSEASYFVSADGASYGFNPTEITEGEWSVTVSAHAVLSPKVTVEVAIYGEN